MRKRLLYILIITLPVIIAIWFSARFGHRQETFYGDAQGYYMYLPSTFIYHNHTNEYKLPADKGIPQSVEWYVYTMRLYLDRTPTGQLLNQYTYGIALMESPFFFAAHAYEKLTGGNANGYSPTYEYMVKFGTITYCLLALALTFLILKRHFSTTISLLTLSMLFAGTNLFWFTAYQAGMAHVPLFFLYALLMWLTIQVHEKPRLRYFIAAGFTVGIITLIRPTDIICLLIPLLYNVHNRQTLAIKKAFLITHRKKILLAAACFITPILPQLYYWKMMTGSYIVYSYGSQGFNWDKPRIIDGLFSFHNGWIAYSPIMIFSLAGMLFYRRIKQWAWCIWLLFAVYVYIIYSWYCYNYINGLGSRPMIHLYTLLAIPFAAFTTYISGKANIAKMAFALVSLFFIAVNISFSMQKAAGILNSEESNFQFNSQMLFRMKMRYNDLVTADIAEWQPDATKLEKTGILKCENYEDPTDAHYTTDTTGRSKFVYHMLDEEHHPNTINIVYNKKDFGDAQWLKCSGRFMIPNGPTGYFKHLLVFSIKRGDDYYKWQGMKITNKIGLADSTCPHSEIELNHIELKKWGYVYFYTKLPAKVKDGDIITLDLWNIGKEEIYMDDICLELYK